MKSYKLTKIISFNGETENEIDVQEFCKEQEISARTINLIDWFDVTHKYTEIIKMEIGNIINNERKVVIEIPDFKITYTFEVR